MSSYCDLDLWPSHVIFIWDISHGVIIHHSKYYGSIVIIHWNRGQNVIFSFPMSYHCPMPKIAKSKNISGAIAPSFIDQLLSYFTERCRMTYSTINLRKISKLSFTSRTQANFLIWSYNVSRYKYTIMIRHIDIYHHFTYSWSISLRSVMIWLRYKASKFYLITLCAITS